MATQLQRGKRRMLSFFALPQSGVFNSRTGELRPNRVYFRLKRPTRVREWWLFRQSNKRRTFFGLSTVASLFMLLTYDERQSYKVERCASGDGFVCFRCCMRNDVSTSLGANRDV